MFDHGKIIEQDTRAEVRDRAAAKAEMPGDLFRSRYGGDANAAKFWNAIG
jgi:hypothetical protein